MSAYMGAKLKTVLASALAALVAGVVSFGVTHTLSAQQQQPRFQLTAASGFSVTATVSSSATSNAAALLYPGVQRYLWYTISNPLSVPLNVTSISASPLTNPANCPATNLDLSKAGFAGSLIVPAKTASGTGTVTLAEPISMIDTNQNQDACANGTFTFAFTGSAAYTDITSTNLRYNSGSDRADVRNTLVATVTEANAAFDPTAAQGKVSFFDCQTPSCTGRKTLVGTVNVAGNGTARLSMRDVHNGNFTAEATFTPTDATNLTASTSNTVRGVNHDAFQIKASSAKRSLPTGSGSTGTVKTSTAVKASGAVNNASNAHTGEPWAGTGPLVAGGTALGTFLLLLGIGMLRRRRHAGEVAR